MMLLSHGGCLMSLDKLDAHIETTPNVAGGRPRIAGHRITVQDIVVWHDRLGLTADEIATDYGLTLGDVHAALAFYFDHRAEIDRAAEEDGAFVKALRDKIPSKVERKLKDQAPGRGD